jgi:hypothetical protein
VERLPYSKKRIEGEVMRFIDANVFLYAILKPKRMLNADENLIKTNAKMILEQINNGEDVLTSVVHLSEVVNVLEDAVNQSFSIKFIVDLLSRSNIIVAPVSKEQYLSAAIIAGNKKVSVNDALASVIMKEHDVNEIYSFDKHFDNLPLKRIHEPE